MFVFITNVISEWYWNFKHKQNSITPFVLFIIKLFVIQNSTIVNYFSCKLELSIWYKFQYSIVSIFRETTINLIVIIPLRLVLIKICGGCIYMLIIHFESDNGNYFAQIQFNKINVVKVPIAIKSLLSTYFIHDLTF